VSKHDRQSKILIKRIIAARLNLARKSTSSQWGPVTTEHLEARKELELAMFGFGVHYSVYACDCHKQVMSTTNGK